MVTGIAERHREHLGPLQEEVDVGLPGEADAAVDLEGRLGHPHAGVAAPDLGGGRRDAGVGITCTERSGRVVDGGPHARDVDPHVGAAVLDRLE